MTSRMVWLCLVLGLGAGLVPFFLVGSPPLQDMPNHLARMAVIAANGADPDLARYYAVNWVAIPNLALDLIAPPLVPFLGVERAGSVFVAMALVLVATGPFAIQHARNGSIGLAPILGLVLMHSEITAIGLINYHFGVGLALWGLAAWIWLDKRPVLRFGAGLGFAIATFFCHVMAAGLFGLGVLAIEIGRLIDRKTAFAPAAITSRGLVAGLSFLALPALFLMSPSSGLGSDDPIMWTMLGKDIGLVIALRAYEGWAEVVVWAGLLLAVGASFALRLVRADWTCRVLIALCIIVYVAAPRAIFDGWLVDQRLPHGMILMTLGFLDVRTPTKRALQAALAGIAALVAVRSTDVALQWREIDATAQAFRAAMAPFPRGVKVGVLLADRPERSIRADATLHLAGHAVVTRSALVSSLFAEPGKQVVAVCDPWRAHVHPGDIWPPTLAEYEASAYPFTLQWCDVMDVIVVLHGGPNRDAPLPGLRAESFNPVFAIWSLQDRAACRVRVSTR
jgi:hypothetical protein